MITLRDKIQASFWRYNKIFENFQYYLSYRDVQYLISKLLNHCCDLSCLNFECMGDHFWTIKESKYLVFFVQTLPINHPESRFI